MKLKKLLWLPLAALLLNGCALGKTVEPSVAQERLVTAVQETEDVELDTYATTTKGESTIVTKDYEGDRVVATEKTTSKYEGALKAKGLKSDEPELSAVYEEITEEKIDGVETYYLKHNEEFYVKNRWLYGGFKTIVRENGGAVTEEQKGKMDISDIDFKEISLLDFLGGFSAGQYVLEAPDEKSLAMIYAIAAEVEAKEMLGTLTITYKLDIKSMIRIMLMIFGLDITTLTDEERAEFEAQVDAAVEEMGDTITVNKYEMTIVISKEGYIQKMRTDIDMLNKEYDDEVEPKVLLATQEVKMVDEINATINKKVTINFPDLSTYQEAQPQ
ncbi:MAG: hypothetical protein BWX57_00529 [Tenericutes bacterium ADurb.Bin024]|nr:MAG: hypothetical protein BWX57_00529 [Tenericutes bacterium ADurb.Bin024]